MSVKQIPINARDIPHVPIHLAHMSVDVMKGTPAMVYPNVMI